MSPINPCIDTLNTALTCYNAMALTDSAIKWLIKWLLVTRTTNYPMIQSGY